METNLKYKLFANIDLKDVFFDSLKKDYPGFNTWYNSKATEGEGAYVNYKDNLLEGFLYLKIDGNCVNDIEPVLTGEKILKIGTFKINPHKTRLGERFIKVALDYALKEGCDICYVTAFDKHVKLIELFKKYGFVKEGSKTTNAGTEGVYVKRFKVIDSDICKNYPLFRIKSNHKYLLSIYPKYHTILFPDSKLMTEKQTGLIKDVSHTNSIHKVYVCNMDVEVMKRGDIVVVYRTAEKNAEYSSVATSICVVEEVRNQNEFINFEDFYRYSSKYSVFDRNDLFYWYKRGKCKAVKMLYNIAFPKRIVRHKLIEEIGLDRNAYWGFFEITDEQFRNILKISGINNRYIIK